MGFPARISSLPCPASVEPYSLIIATFAVQQGHSETCKYTHKLICKRLLDAGVYGRCVYAIVFECVCACVCVWLCVCVLCWCNVNHNVYLQVPSWKMCICADEYVTEHKYLLTHQSPISSTKMYWCCWHCPSFWAWIRHRMEGNTPQRVSGRCVFQYYVAVYEIIIHRYVYIRVHIKLGKFLII